MKYRLFIDIPLSENLEESLMQGHKIIDILKKTFAENINGVEVNYRLGNDADRQRSNYFDINQNGHCSNKKSTFSI